MQDRHLIPLTTAISSSLGIASCPRKIRFVNGLPNLGYTIIITVVMQNKRMNN